MLEIFHLSTTAYNSESLQYKCMHTKTIKSASLVMTLVAKYLNHILPFCFVCQTKQAKLRFKQVKSSRNPQVLIADGEHVTQPLSAAILPLINLHL